MLKKLFANTKAKKTSIFIAVFAITCIVMGNRLNSFSDEASFIQASIAGIKTIAEQAEGQASDMVEAVIWATSSRGGLSSYYVGQGKADDESDAFDADVTVSQIPPAVNPPTIEFAYAQADGFVFSPAIPLSYELQQHTHAKCVEYGLEYELVLAVMWRESRFDINAININTNGTQDSGIMQINDVNRSWLLEKHGISDLMDPVQNINAGTAILGEFTRKYGVQDALLAYQYGENGMLSKRQQGVASNDKIAHVLEQREYYKRIIESS